MGELIAFNIPGLTTTSAISAKLRALASEGTDDSDREVEQRVLANEAAEEYQIRRRREKFIPAALCKEPAWDMLLELFQAHTCCRNLRTTSLCIASGAPTTTALRWIDVLEKEKFISREIEMGDNRATIVRLTELGLNQVTKSLRDSVMYRRKRQSKYSIR